VQLSYYPELLQCSAGWASVKSKDKAGQAIEKEPDKKIPQETVKKKRIPLLLVVIFTKEIRLSFMRISRNIKNVTPP
jgi:hypothetical protein